MKRKIVAVILVVLPLVLSAFCFVSVQSQPTATMYVEPASINGALDLGATFTATIMFRDFVDLWTWQVTIIWDPSVINCTAFRYGLILSDNVYEVLAPGRTYLQNSGGLIPGELRGTACSLTAPPSTGVDGEAGVGYKLVELDFEVVGYGSTTIDFKEPPLRTFWLTSAIEKQPCDFEPSTVETKPPATGGPTANFTWTPPIPENCTAITFDATASEPGWNETGMCPITEYRWDFGDGNQTTVSIPTITHHYTLPNDFSATLEVYAPGATPETDTLTKTIPVIPEFPAGIILPILMILTLITVILGKLLVSTKQRGHIIAKQKAI